jgi:hypothetical protein
MAADRTRFLKFFTVIPPFYRFQKNFIIRLYKSQEQRPKVYNYHLKSPCCPIFLKAENGLEKKSSL